MLMLVSVAFAAAGDITISDVDYTSADLTDIALEVDLANAGAADLGVNLTATLKSLPGLSVVTVTNQVVEVNVATGGSYDNALVNLAGSFAEGDYIVTVNANDNITGNLYDSFDKVVTVVDSTVVAASPSLQANTLEIGVESGEDSRTESIVVTNNGNVDLTGIVITYNLSTVDDDDDTFTFSLSGTQTSLAQGASFTLFGTVSDIENGFDVGTVSGSITFTSGTYTKTIDLNVDVRPLVCEFGEVGNDIDLSIDEPSGDDFFPGEDVYVRIDVQNNDNNDMDVKVQVEVWNLDENKKIWSDSSDQKIDNDDEEAFTFDFVLDVDDIDDPDDNIVMYVIAFDEDNEEDNCVADQEDIDLKDEDDMVVINAFDLLPQSGYCGDTIEAIVDVQNVGTDSQDGLHVSISHTGLGISAIGSSFDIDDFGDKDDQYTDRITFQIPSDAEAGEYDLRSYITFEGGKEYKEATFVVLGCGDEPSFSDDRDESSSDADSNMDSNSGSQGSQVTGGAVVDKNIFDSLASDDNLPTWLWVILIVVVVLAIVAILIALLRK